MEKIPCIKCDSQLWEYIKLYLEKWDYKIYHVDNWTINPILILNYTNCSGKVLVTNLSIDAPSRFNRELVTNVEEFLERAAKLKGFTYIRKDMKKFTKADLKPGMVIEYNNGAKRLVTSCKKGIFLTGDKYKTADGLNALTEDLKCSYTDHSIDKVYTIKWEVTLDELFNTDNLELIWERPKEVVLTMDQIAEKFGIPVEQLKIQK